MTYDKMHPFQKNIITLAGEMAEMLSFNRSLGQIFGFLYISPEPVSLEDIASACYMSKANASLHLRTLETWGAVHRSWRPGTRKDYYTAADDLKKIAFRRLHEGIARRLEHARQQLNDIKADPAYRDALNGGENNRHWQKRMQEVESLLEQIEKGFKLIPKLFKLKSFLG